MGKVHIKLLFLFISLGATMGKLSTRSRPKDESLLMKVCENTLHRSNIHLFYIVNLSRDKCCTQTIQHLHNNEITTVQYNQANFSLHMIDDITKNVVVIVNDCSDLLNFMLSSMAGHWDSYKHDTNYPICKNCTSTKSRSVFPNICLVNLKSGVTTRDRSRPCDATLDVTVGDIEDGRVLKGGLLAYTKQAYNRFWNADNFFIFVVLTEQQPGKQESCNLYLTFRLMWRIYKGRKTVICSLRECLWYDAFFNRTHVFTGSSEEDYFDFSWRFMNHRAATYLLVETPGKLTDFEDNTGYLIWQAGVFDSLDAFMDLRSANYKLPLGRFFSDDIQTDKELIVKYDLSLLFVDATHPHSLSSRADFENYDHSTITEFGSYCFFVPRRGFKPQYLTVFKCFSPKVWACFLITVVTFSLLHRYHTRFQSQRFARLYTEGEIVRYESSSTVLTIYRYFLCVCQPRLLLGKLVSGKIFFCVFTMAAIVLTTLLQSGMVTFLNTRIRYADIDSVQQLRESDLLVQTVNPDSDKVFFGRDEQLGWVKERLVESYEFSYEVYSSWVHYCKDLTNCTGDDRRGTSNFERFSQAKPRLDLDVGRFPGNDSCHCETELGYTDVRSDLRVSRRGRVCG
ncbi:unnamed protein product [Bemisia tabaci]|uniref:Ionotropic receptor n=1 Tax=Bemisia tabaci TaxID=7038 RepID=A0A9P0CAG6_BEMTA|nr:unnamed protein product [Bemisia tabaci]